MNCVVWQSRHHSRDRSYCKIPGNTRVKIRKKGERTCCCVLVVNNKGTAGARPSGGGGRRIYHNVSRVYIREQLPARLSPIPFPSHAHCGRATALLRMSTSDTDVQCGLVTETGTWMMPGFHGVG